MKAITKIFFSALFCFAMTAAIAGTGNDAKKTTCTKAKTECTKSAMAKKECSKTCTKTAAAKKDCAKTCTKAKATTTAKAEDNN